MRAMLVMILAGTANANPTAKTVVDELTKPGCTDLLSYEPTFGKIPYDKSKADGVSGIDLPVTKFVNAGIRKAHADISVDIYHVDPKTVDDPRVGNITFTIDPKTDISASMKAIPGTTTYMVGKDTVWHNGRIYYHRNELVLACDAPPDWSLMPWTADAVKTTVAAITSFLDGKSTTFPTDERYSAITYPDSLSINFTTAIPAIELMTTLGMTKVIVRATDVHMTNTRLFHVDNGKLVYKTFELSIKVRERDSKKPADLAKLSITQFVASKPSP
ncbi:MAG: hypothetical protein QM831_32055 [Kofleriaceae bacterium]